jgi:hypothetical protein
MLPREKQIERQGLNAEGYSKRHPEVRGGICEFCGVQDKNAESIHQYKLCEHYRGMQLKCSYCPPEKDPDEVIRYSVLKIADHPNNPSQLVVWCDSFKCSEKHLARFSQST